ncbi:MAG: TonB-dependent receptor [Flavobacteriales bacterium]|nr:TonB-dependent receptor [Flavobacteriales bacterium]
MSILGVAEHLLRRSGLSTGLAAFLIPLNAFGQQVTVVDAATLKPLEAATVHHPGTGASAITDARGRAELSAFTGADSISFRMIGYEPRVLSYQQVLGMGNRVGMSALPFRLDAFVVSANRWEQERERVPDQITVINPREVALNNPGTAADMLQQSGEVFMQKSQLGGGSPMLRGFAANRVLIVVDGVRMNNAIYRAGNLQNVISVDANAIDRAEVIHGPGAMTYGSDAIGGVMDFHLLRARFSMDSSLLLHGGAMARYGSAANEMGGNLHFGLGGRKLAFVGNASFTRFGDLRAGSVGPMDYQRPWYVERINDIDSMVVNDDPNLQVGSAYDNINLFGKLAFKPVETLELGVNVYYSTTTDVPRYDRLIELRPNGMPRSAEWYYGPQEWMMGSFTAKHWAKRGPWSTARLSIANQDYTESRNDRNYRNASKRTQAEQIGGIWTNLDFEKRISARTQLLYGAEHVTNTVASSGVRVNQTTSEETIINSRYPNGAEWSTGSAYIGAMHDATDRLTLSAGARCNWSALEARFDTSLFAYPATSTSLSNSAITGNLGAAFRPGTGWKLSIDLSTGFRAPNIDDIGKVFDSEPGAVIVPNPDLKAEYAYSAEAGIEKTMSEKIRLRGNAFYVLLDNAMVRRPFTLNGADSISYDGEPSRVDAIQNAAQARVIGFTLGIDARITKNLALDARYNWQDGVEQDDASTTDVPLRHAPPPFGQAGITWERKKVRVQAFVQFSSGFTFDELPPSEQAKLPVYALDAEMRPHAPSWHTLNLRASYQVSRVVLVSGGVENITDQRYRPYSSGISAPGRNFIIALRARF